MAIWVQRRWVPGHRVDLQHGADLCARGALVSRAHHFDRLRTARVVITAFTHPLALETTLKAWVKYVSSMILGEACSGVEQSRYVRFNLVGRRAEIRRSRLHARV